MPSSSAMRASRSASSTRPSTDVSTPTVSCRRSRTTASCCGNRMPSCATSRTSTRAAPSPPQIRGSARSPISGWTGRCRRSGRRSARSSSDSSGRPRNSVTPMLWKRRGARRQTRSRCSMRISRSTHTPPASDSRWATFRWAAAYGAGWRCPSSGRRCRNLARWFEGLAGRAAYRSIVMQPLS